MPTTLQTPNPPPNPPRNSPPWQKAIFRHSHLVPLFLRGKDIFVYRAQPLWTIGAHPVSGEATTAAWCYLTNLISAEGKATRVQVDFVELDPLDWAWSVMQIPWEAWGVPTYARAQGSVPKNHKRGR